MKEKEQQLIIYNMSTQPVSELMKEEQDARMLRLYLTDIANKAEAGMYFRVNKYELIKKIKEIQQITAKALLAD